jgi:hypothetical protein
VGLAALDGEGDGRGDQLGRVGREPPGPAGEVPGTEALVKLGFCHRRVHDGDGDAGIGELDPSDLG